LIYDLVPFARNCSKAARVQQLGDRSQSFKAAAAAAALLKPTDY